MEDQAVLETGDRFHLLLPGKTVTCPGRGMGRGRGSTADINTLEYYLQLLLKWSQFLQRLHCGPG